MTRLKMLVVEDEPILLDQAADFFDLYTNIDILKAKTGEEAVDIIYKEKPEIIILDLKLGDYPAMDGIAVLRKIRKFDAYTDVIVMTALRDESLEAEALMLGTRAYFKKPFSSQLLFDEVDAILKERGVAKY